MINFGPYDGRDGHENCLEMLVDMTRQFELQYARAEALQAALNARHRDPTLDVAYALLREIYNDNECSLGIKSSIEAFWDEYV